LEVGDLLQHRSPVHAWDAVKKLGDDFFANALGGLELTKQRFGGLSGRLANWREVPREQRLRDDPDCPGDGASLAVLR